MSDLNFSSNKLFPEVFRCVSLDPVVHVDCSSPEDNVRIVEHDEAAREVRYIFVAPFINVQGEVLDQSN